jgi:hypothetical protein
VTLTASGGGTYLWNATGGSATTAAITASAAGTDTVTATAANGCTATASQVVTVNMALTAGITVTGSTTFCTGGSVTLTATGGGTYSWKQALRRRPSARPRQVRTVTATAANGCTATANKVVTVNSATATITLRGITTSGQAGLH